MYLSPYFVETCLRAMKIIEDFPDPPLPAYLTIPVNAESFLGELLVGCPGDEDEGVDSFITHVVLHMQFWSHSIRNFLLPIGPGGTVKILAHRITYLRVQNTNFTCLG